jgi:hypothetical protein
LTDEKAGELSGLTHIVDIVIKKNATEKSGVM